VLKSAAIPTGDNRQSHMDWPATQNGKLWWKQCIRPGTQNYKTYRHEEACKALEILLRGKKGL
jgi:hypothetical protein